MADTLFYLPLYTVYVTIYIKIYSNTTVFVHLFVKHQVIFTDQFIIYTCIHFIKHSGNYILHNYL